MNNKKLKKAKMVWYFQTFTLEERDEWVNIIRNVMSVEELLFPKVTPKNLIDVNIPKNSDLMYHYSYDVASKDIKKIENELKKLQLDQSHAESEHLAEIDEEQMIRRKLKDLESYESYLKKCKMKCDYSAWDVKFQKFWSEVIDSDRDLNASLSSSERLIDHVGKFKLAAEFYVKGIINELHRPLVKRAFKPLHKLTPTLELHCDDEKDPTLYFINGILLKMCMRESVAVRYIHKQSFLEEKWKAYNREFNTFNLLFNALYLLSKPNEDCNIRVPLSCIIDYKGFRGLAIACMPLNKELDPVVGLTSDNIYRETILEGIAKQLPSLGKLLNIKDHSFTFVKATQPIHVWLSALAEIHRRDNTQTIEDEELLKLKKEKPEWDLSNYEIDYNKDVYYALKTYEILPIDYNQAGNTYLRHEFLYNYKKPLRSDLLKPRVQLLINTDVSEENKADLNDLMEAKKELITVAIKKLVKQLDSLEIIPTDSAMLTQAFHRYGVNMRYLGVVAEQSTLNHVKECCIIEMLARTLKGILQKQLSERIMHGEMYKKVRNERKAYYVNLAKSVKEKYEDFPVPTELRNLMHGKGQKMEGYVLEIVYDYMNLVFGNNKESKEFWKQILIPHTANTFNYDPDKLSKVNARNNALLLSFTYHFGIELSGEFELGKTVFTNQITSIHTKTKVYNLCNIPLVVFAGKYKEYKAANKTQLALKALKLKSAMSRALYCKEDLVAIYETAELLLEEGLTDKAIECATKGLLHANHCQLLNLYFVLIKAYYQKNNQVKANEYCIKAMQKLKYYWGVYHPLHIVIYSLMAFHLITYKGQYEQGKELYEASLICASRALGCNHVVTGRVYMDLGMLQMKMGSVEQAAVMIEKGYLIYDGIDEEYNAELAHSADLLSSTMVQQKRYKEALSYSQKAAKLYETIKGIGSELCMTNILTTISISFYLKLNDTVNTIFTHRYKNTAIKY